MKSNELGDLNHIIGGEKEPFARKLESRMSKQTLAAASGTLAEAPKFELPAIFQEPSEKIVGRFSTPYITFAHRNRKDEWGKLVGKFGNIDEGDMFLIEGDNVTRLTVAKLCVVKIRQYWVEKNAAGEVLKSSFTEMPYPWAEHMDVVGLVLLDDRAVVVNINPHTTKCGGFKTLADAFEECTKPEWADKSPAHKETLKIGQPFMRFFGELSVASPRISKKSGLPYRTTPCVIKPTTNVEANLLRAFAASPESNKALVDAAERFAFRMKEIETKLVKK